MRFSFWPALFLLVVLPLLYRRWLARNRPANIRIPLNIPATVARSNPVKWILFLRYLAMSAFIIALARPQTSYQNTQRSVSGVDIVMVMDVSASMNIEDLSEKSRLEIAKDTMRNFIKGRQNDRIGFVVFSGEPLTLAPPTLDYGLVLKAVRDVETGKLKDGTAIGDGLSLAVNRLSNSKAKSRIVVLLTDGDNNMGQIDPSTAGELAAGYGIKVYSIAIGRDGRVKLPIKQKNIFGQTITTYQLMENVINPALLKQISEATNGKFYRVTDVETLVSVFREIDQLEKSEIQSKQQIRYKDVFEIPLVFGFFILALESLMGFFWWRIVP